MAKELARLQQKLQSVQDTLPDEHSHFSLVGQTYELELQAAQLSLANKQKQFPSTSQSEEELQAVNEPPCSPTKNHHDELAAITDILTLWDCSSHTSSPSEIFPELAKDVHGSDINLNLFSCASGGCILEYMDTPVPNGILQKLALPRPKPKPRLSLKKDAPSQSDVPRPQPKPRLSLKRNSKVHTSLDAISHQDSLKASTASGDVYCGSKCTPTL